MYKVGDKVLYRDSEKNNVWHEGIIRARDSAFADHWCINGVVKDVIWRYERDIKPRTSPNELTMIVNIDASAAAAELDALGEMITQRVKGAVAAGLAGETADLVRERDALREELAACKRERDEAKAALAEGVAFVADFKAQLRTTLECLAREEEV